MPHNAKMLDESTAQVDSIGVIKIDDRVVYEVVLGAAEEGVIKRFFVPADPQSDAYPIAEIHDEDWPEDDPRRYAYVPISLIEDRA